MPRCFHWDGKREGLSALTRVMLQLARIALIVAMSGVFASVAAAANSPVEMILNPERRQDGITRLSSMSRPKGLGVVNQFFKRHSKDAEARRLLMNELASGNDATRGILAAVAAGPSPGLAEEAYRALLQKGYGPLLTADMLRRLAKTKPLSLALISVEQLLAQGDTRMRPLLRKNVRNRRVDMALRVACVRALGEFGGNGSVQFLTMTYQMVQQEGAERTVSLRRALLNALAKRGGVDAAPILIDALRVSDLWETAVENLVQIGEPALPSLRLVLETGDRQVEPGVLAVLFELGGIDSKRFLHMLESTSEATRSRARWILLAFPDPELVPELLKLWKSPSGYPTRSELLDILIPYYSDDSVRKLFSEALQSQESAVVEVALRVIAGMDDKELYADVKALAEDDSRAEVRIRAIEAMVELGLFEGRELLERMLQYEEFEVRKVAAWGLRWLGDPAVTANALWDAKDARHPQMRPLLVHAGAKLAGKNVLLESRPAHYGLVEAFDKEEAYEDADSDRSEIKFRGEVIEIITMGSDDDALVVFLPMQYSDPVSILASMKAVAGDRTVIFFRKKEEQGVAPHRINPVLGRWFQGAAEAVIKAREVEGPVDVMGWSMGAGWATMFCAAKPKRCRTLTLASPMSLDFAFWMRTVPSLVRKLTPAPFVEDVVFLDSVKNRFAKRAWGIYYEQYLSRIQVVDDQGAVELSQMRTPMLYEVPEVPFLDLERTLKKLRSTNTPVTLVVGDDDLFAAEWLAIPKLGEGKGLYLHRVPGAGHFALYESPEESGRLLEEALSAE